jgi:hypothetical protein
MLSASCFLQNQLIEKDGLEKIKAELKKLIYGSNDLVDRYNELRKNIAGFWSFYFK